MNPIKKRRLELERVGIAGTVVQLAVPQRKRLPTRRQPDIVEAEDAVEIEGVVVGGHFCSPVLQCSSFIGRSVFTIMISDQ